MACAIKKGDLVEVLAGKDKGRQGNILRVDPKQNKVLVEGVNMQTKATKPNPNAGVQGGLVKREAVIHISNVAVVNPNTGKKDRVGFKHDDKGRKVRYCKSDEHLLDG